MDDTPAPIPDDAYLDAAARTVGLTIAPEHREGVLRFLAIAAEFAAMLDEAPVEDDHQAHAPVFRLPEF
ncbi:MAG: hypothetical protein AcusKO_20430 [Acuticoccus sp.]